MATWVNRNTVQVTQTITTEVSILDMRANVVAYQVERAALVARIATLDGLIAADNVTIAAYEADVSRPAATPFTAVMVTPAINQLDAAINTDIEVVFSEEVDQSTVINGAFSVMNGATPVTGTLSFSVSRTLIFTPTSALLSGATYDVSLSASILSRLGTALTAYSASFTTSA
ncbi:MAG: Ig-like domain-containing protein [Patescibacteria group bacterium]